MKKEIDGPDGYWSPDLPVSRGQWRDIAELSLKLLGVAPPENRLDATVAMVRLRAALSSDDAPEHPPLPQPW